LDDDSLHSLLARGRLSGAQRERVLEGALRKSRAGIGRWAAVGGGVALSVAASAILWIATSETPRPDVPRSTAFVAKGTPGPVLVASCPNRPVGECRVGDKLIFEIGGADERGFFAAYAECAGRERIWYFPTASGALPEIDPGRTRNVVGQAARIGPEHGLGHCELSLFAVPQKLSRAALLAGGAERFRTNLALEVEP